MILPNLSIVRANSYPLKEDEIKLTKRSRWLVYILFVISNILISLDHGSIPAVTAELRKIVYDDQLIGLFGSLVFVGNILGSSISFYLINKVNRKTLLILSLFLMSICLITFVLYTNILFMFGNRIFVGIFQSYITIYLPVWCNQYGMENKKSLMITFTQLVVPLGVFMGYFLASLTVDIDYLGRWKFSFIIQGLGVLILGIVIIFVPKIYFDNDLEKIKGNALEEQIKNLEDISVFKINSKKKDSGPIENEAIQGNPIENYPNEQNNNGGIIDNLKAMLSHKVYLFMVLALTTLFYVITGIQYWVSDYMDRILLIRTPKKRLLYFTIVCFTSPTIGVLIGGYVLSYIGGYEKKESIYLALGGSILAALFAFFIPFTRSIIVFIILLWFALFFGGGTLPTLTGIIVSSLPSQLSASGFSFNTLIGNLLGYLPAPYIYGLITDILDDKGKVAMAVNLWISFIGVIFVLFAIHYRFKDESKIKEESEEDKELKEKLLKEESPNEAINSLKDDLF